MPKIEQISSPVPTAPIKEIPVRIANTRNVGPKPKQAAPPEPQNGNQATNGGSNSVADSAAPAESVKLSPQLSAIARKEQAFRQREFAIQQREKDLEAQLAEAQQFKELKTKMGAKDFSEAEKLGLNYDEYVKYKLDQANGEDPQAKATLELKSEIEKMKKEQKDRDEREFEDTKSAYATEIAKLVQSNPEFSSIKELKREDAVLKLILDAWEEDGEEMTVEQACKDIEDFIVEQGKKMTELTKFKAKPEAERKLPPPRPSVNTLTNNMLPPSGEPKPTVSLSDLSESERYAEARRRVQARRQAQGA